MDIYKIQNLTNEPASGAGNIKAHRTTLLCSSVICVFCLIVHQIGIENSEIENWSSQMYRRNRYMNTIWIA